MSIATQIERLQGVRDQIRTKMVSLGLSENTDLLQNLANDLDGVNKVSPTNNGTTDPGSSYTNVDTLSRSTSTRYIKVPKGYNDADRKFTVSGVANGSVSAATTTDPGTGYTNQTTVTPSGTSAQYVKITAGYLPNSKITVSKMAAGSYSASVASHTTSNATASSSVTGSITDVATTTKPSGTDGTNYYTITPKLTTAAGSSKATGKATIDTAGYLAAGNKSSSESSKSVGVTATQGDNYYLKAGAYSASVASHTVSNATASSSVTGSITDVATSTKPTSGTDGTDYYTITPKLTTAAGSSKATGKATVGTAGYLATGSATSSESSKSVGVTATQGGDYYLKAGKSSDVTATVTAGISNITSINASQVTDGVTVTASASGSTIVPVGYYSTQVSKTPSNSKSTTIKPKLAGTNGAIELTAGTSAFTKTSTADYSNGFITSVKVNPTPSQSKTAAPSTSEQTISPDNGKLLSSVAISAIPTETKTITAGTSASTTSATSGKFITSVTVNPTPSQSKSVTPTIAKQTVSPDSGKLLSSVTVNAVPSFTVAFTSASWSSDGNLTLGQYYATVSSDYITASNNLYVIPRSESDITAAQSFGIYAYSQSNGSMQFRAVAKPTSTVTYTVYYLN